MPKADVSEERIVISECGQRSTDWWDTLLDQLKAHHIPGRYQDGKRNVGRFAWQRNYLFHIRYGIVR
jgi:hypothetical protein